MDGMALSHWHAVGWQFTACSTFLQVLIKAAQRRHVSFSKSFSTIPMMEQKEFSNSQPCAPALLWRML
jgi:hypothetical protein